MKKLSKEILNYIGEYFLSQVGTRTKKHTYLGVETVRKYYAKDYSVRQLTNALHYLRRRKYIQYKQDGTDRQFVLTTQGAMRFFIYCDFVTKQKVGDGKMSLVVVEAPEEKRAVRDFLRRRLTQSGFKKISRGVYLSEYRLNANLSLYSKLYGLKDIMYAGEFKILS